MNKFKVFFKFMSISFEFIMKSNLNQNLSMRSVYSCNIRTVLFTTKTMFEISKILPEHSLITVFVKQYLQAPTDF